MTFTIEYRNGNIYLNGDPKDRKEIMSELYRIQSETGWNREYMERVADSIEQGCLMDLK